MRNRTFEFRGRDVFAALGALAIPTAATIFAVDVERWPGWAKWGAFSIWAVCALQLAIDTFRRDRKIDQVTSAALEQRLRRRNQAVDMALRGILEADPEWPNGWTWTVYLFDSERRLLIPSWPVPDPADADLFDVKAFAPGAGAAGQAFENPQVIIRLGEEVHDGTHGLTEQQQQYFAGRHAVVAAPIFADDDTVIGTLTAIADDADDYFHHPKNRHQLEATANVVGTLMEMLHPAP